MLHRDIELQDFRDHWGGANSFIYSSETDQDNPCESIQEKLLYSSEFSLALEKQGHLSTRWSKTEKIKHMRSSCNPGFDELPSAFYKLNTKTMASV